MAKLPTGKWYFRATQNKIQLLFSCFHVFMLLSLAQSKPLAEYLSLAVLIISHFLPQFY